MAVSNVNTQYSLNSANQTQASNKNLLDKNAFLYILTAELSNQDPENAKDNTEYVAQLAQFSSLEQAQNTNTSMTKLLTSQKLTEGAMLIGKQVQFQTDADNTVTDTVKSVKVQDGNVYLVGENDTYDIETVSEVGEMNNGQ